MTPFEFAMGLITIIVGVAVSDIAVSAHRLLRQGRSVHWDARVIGTGAFAFLLVLQLWFMTWTIRDLSGGFPFPLYLALLIQLFVASLIASASLPDEPVIDLAAFYDHNARYFWSLTTIFQLISLVLGAYFAAHDGALRDALPFLALWGLPLAMALVLALRPRGRILHLVLTAASILFILIYYWKWTLRS